MPFCMTVSSRQYTQRLGLLPALTWLVSSSLPLLRSSCALIRAAVHTRAFQRHLQKARKGREAKQQGRRDESQPAIGQRLCGAACNCRTVTHPWLLPPLQILTGRLEAELVELQQTSYGGSLHDVDWQDMGFSFAPSRSACSQHHIGPVQGQPSPHLKHRA